MNNEISNMLKQIIEALTKDQKVDLFANDIPPQTINYWKKGERNPTYVQCVILSKITGANLSKLLTEIALKEYEMKKMKKRKDNN